MSETSSSVQVLKPTSALKELNYNIMSAPVGILRNTNHEQQKKPSANALSDSSESDIEGANQGDYLQGDETEPEGGLNPEEARETLKHENIIKCGYLEKKQEIRNNWKRRWFVLRPTKLAYYKSEKEYELLQNLDLNDIRAVAEVKLKNKTDVFGIVTPKRTYYVHAASKKELDEWVDAINKVKKEVQDSDLLDVDDEGSQADSEIMNSYKGKSPANKLHSLKLETPLSSGQAVDEAMSRSPESPGIEIPRSPPFQSSEQGEGAAGPIPNGLSSPSSPVTGQFAPDRKDSSSEEYEAEMGEEEENDDTIRSGYVYKLDRYKGKRAHKNINLSDILDAIEIDDISKSKQHCFKIITPKRNYICRASSEELQVAWLAALQMALNKTKEKRKE
ncbi:5985_t:CDS:2 [Acaulospora colombiana]|uniref:5985_t:CDS:1 n=1 Tax=Acaulospora colombiana TaxID=27376 RepID=A0ACA9L810_9GLOM|nr:5985_t:CDS:2 [Acaulospora colombiana]